MKGETGQGAKARNAVPTLASRHLDGWARFTLPTLQVHYRASVFASMYPDPAPVPAPGHVDAPIK